MDPISVYHNDLKGILKKVKEQGIGIKVQNTSAIWSDHFYNIEEIKEFQHRQFKLTVLILYDPVESDSTVIDLKTVRCIQLQSPFSFDSRVLRNIKVLQ